MSPAFEHRFLNSLKKLLRECLSMEAIEKAQQNDVSAEIHQLFTGFLLAQRFFTLVMNFFCKDGILPINTFMEYSFRIFGCFGNFSTHQFTEILF